MIDIEKSAEKLEDKQSKCEHQWNFIHVWKSIFNVPYYRCTKCSKIKFIDFDEEGNIKN